MVAPVVISLLILVVAYLFLFLDKMHRTIIGIAGATAMVIAGKLFGFYGALPSEGLPLQQTALGAIDWNTLGLLFGMMIIVGITEETGIFEYVSIRLAKLTRGNYWLLMLALGWFTFIASAIVDNVTTVIFVGSITVSIAARMRANPIPLLINEAIMSGLGGLATLVGDPPNIMIGSAAGFSFIDFLIHIAPVAIVVGLAASAGFRWLYRHDLLRGDYDISALMSLDERQEIGDGAKLLKMLGVIGTVLLLFLLHDTLGLLPSEAALIGASLALLLVRADLVEILGRVKWDVLLFFAGLFVMVGGLEAAGVLAQLANWIGAVVLQYPIWALLVILWGSAAISAVIDNVPFTIAVIPIILQLGRLGADVAPLWWALAAGVAIGGCATPIGASANVYVMSLSERSGHRIAFGEWVRVGIPTVATLLIVASALLYGMYELGLI